MNTLDQARRINELETELAAWKTYVDQLARAVRPAEKRLFPPAWGLRKREAEILLAIFDSGDAPISASRIYAALYGAKTDLREAEYKVVHVHMCRIRKVAAAQGVEVRTRGTSGYWISQDHRDLIARSLLTVSP